METNLTDNNIEMKPGENDIILPKSGILHKYWHKLIAVNQQHSTKHMYKNKFIQTSKLLSAS